MQTLISCLLLLLFIRRSSNAAEMPINFDWHVIKFGTVESSKSGSPVLEHDPKLFYKVKTSVTRRHSRSIADAVIETVRCEHIELMDCDSYDTPEMTCAITATGMPCCICSGKLKSLQANKRKWSLW